MIVLAGDIGGTNARLALFEMEPVRAGERPELKQIFERSTPSRSRSSLDDIVEAFLHLAEVATQGRIAKGKGIDAACLGVAGPVDSNRDHLTNLPWILDRRSLAARIGIAGVTEEPACRPLIKPETAAALAAPSSGDRDAAAEISKRGLAGIDPICEMSLALFCSVLGAVAGSLGLAVMATGGVFVAGGIAPRILEYLQKGGFREAFERKGRLRALVGSFPAFVVTQAEPGLIGAAMIAARS